MSFIFCHSQRLSNLLSERTREERGSHLSVSHRGARSPVAERRIFAKGEYPSFSLPTLIYKLTNRVTYDKILSLILTLRGDYMKLTKHQKDIVGKIINGQIYDIASYLESTNNFRVEKYDIDAIRKKFVDVEGDKKYKVAKDSIFIKGTYGLPMFKPEDKITENDYTIKKAVFVDNAPAIHYEFEGVKYDLDFVKGVKVVNDYELLIDFLTLWHYLKEESLILELDKKLETQDVGFFFEPKEIDESMPKAKIVIKKD